MAMAWESIVWCGILATAALVIVVDLLCAAKGKLEGRGFEPHWGRICIAGVPLLVTAWIYCSALCCTWNLRQARRAMVQERWEDLSSYYAPYIETNDRIYSRFQLLEETKKHQHSPYALKQQDLSMFTHRAAVHPRHPFHLYIEPRFDNWGLGVSLVRFRITPAGWKIDESKGWGCSILEEDRRFLDGLVMLPGWN